MNEWIIVASRAEAKIFKRSNGTKNLRWVQTLANSKGRWRERKFGQDKPGLSHAKFAGIRSPHVLEAQDTHADVVALHFAHTIGKTLAKGFREKEFSKATIFAAPKLLGKIKKALPARMQNTILTFISKDIEKASTDQIKKHLSA